MSKQLNIGLSVCVERATVLARRIPKPNFITAIVRIYGVPRGGIPVAMLLVDQLQRRGVFACLTEQPEEADYIVDDLIDSGATRARYAQQFPNTPFLALFDKITDKSYAGRWLVFPWERTEDNTEDDDIFCRLIQFVGEDVNRDGLKNTPARMQKAWREWTSGYDTDFAQLLTTFDNDENYDEMITVRRLPFYSFCEHHMAPFFGTADISYIPGEAGQIVGLSKLSRVLQGYARRLQVQERLTQQVASCIMKYLQPSGVGVILRARHLCMESRGIAQQGHETVTTALLGCYREPGARQEFLNP